MHDFLKTGFGACHCRRVVKLLFSKCMMTALMTVVCLFSIVLSDAQPYRMPRASSDSHVIDGNSGTVKHLASVLGLPYGNDPDGLLHCPPEGSVTYMISGRPADKAELAKFERLHARLDIV